MNVRRSLIDLGAQLQAEDEAAFQLWSWLPSYRAAEKAHGEHACEHRPSVRDVLAEAAEYLSHKMNPTPEQVQEAGELYRCPCGECGTGFQPVQQEPPK